MRGVVHRDGEARLEDVDLLHDAVLLVLGRRRRVLALLRAADALLTLALGAARRVAVLVAVLVVLALPLAAPLLALRRLGVRLGRHVHLGGLQPPPQRQADGAVLVGALAVVPHQPLGERAARVLARVARAALPRVVGHERLGRGALGDGAVDVGALHHVRKHEQVVCLRLHAAVVEAAGDAVHAHPSPHAHRGAAAGHHLHGRARVAHAHAHAGAPRRALVALHQRLQLLLCARAVRDDALLARLRVAVLGVDVGERPQLLADGAVRRGALEEVGVDLLHLVAVRHRAVGVAAARRVHEHRRRGHLEPLLLLPLLRLRGARRAAAARPGAGSRGRRGDRRVRRAAAARGHRARRDRHRARHACHGGRSGLRRRGHRPARLARRAGWPVLPDGGHLDVLLDRRRPRLGLDGARAVAAEHALAVCERGAGRTRPAHPAARGAGL